MDQPQFGSLWDTVRAWADSAGLLRPQDPSGARPHVPQSVCDSCPICQSAATLEQVNPEVLSELADVARSLVAGMGSALASATEQRLAGDGSTGDVVTGEQAVQGDDVRARDDEDAADLPPDEPEQG